jgi:CheY-like chemotaxis protein
MSRKKILIVDDSQIVLKALSMKIKGAGYDVLTAEDGGSAVSTARRERPNLILLDISFPPDVAHGGGVPWDGFLILAWLRRMEECKDIPVIVITGGDPVKLQDKSIAAGALAFFHKPINNEELLATIRQVIGDGEPPSTDTTTVRNPATPAH